LGDFFALGDFFGLGDFLVDESGRMFTETINAPFAKDGNTSKSGTLYRRVICVLAVECGVLCSVKCGDDE